MKKAYLIIILFALITYSCEKPITNPGDFSIPVELSVVEVFDTLGNNYKVEVIRTIDTTYMYTRVLKDTLKDASGKPILDEQNRYQISEKQEEYAGTITGKLYELKPIVLESARTLLKIKIMSNARWQAPIPDFEGKIAWFRTQTNAGGGDAEIKVEVSRGLLNNRRPILANQYIFSRDSTVMVKMSFDQKSRNE